MQLELENTKTQSEQSEGKLSTNKVTRISKMHKIAQFSLVKSKAAFYIFLRCV